MSILTVEKIQKVVEDRRGHHQTRVDGASDNSAQWIPSTVVEPIMERVEALVREELSRPVVEVRIEFVDHDLVPEDGEEPHGKC